MDIFGDDIDSLMPNEDDNLNENIRDDREVDNDDNENEEKVGDSEPIKVEPKKRTVRNPQLRLNAERLTSTRGIHTVENYFKDMKYHGKGHEREDLNNVMKRLEHWAHRLYPNYKFDDFTTTVEKLGKKKQVQTHLHRYRQGMLEEVTNKDQQSAEEENENVEDAENDYPIDELDEIIDQQIQNYTMVPKTPAHERTFDSIRSSMITSPRLREQSPIEASTPIIHRKIDRVAPHLTAPLSSEQMAKIAENRRLAQERLRKKKLEAEAALAAANNPDITITNETISNESN